MFMFFSLSDMFEREKHTICMFLKGETYYTTPYVVWYSMLQCHQRMSPKVVDEHQTQTSIHNTIGQISDVKVSISNVYFQGE